MRFYLFCIVRLYNVQYLKVRYDLVNHDLLKLEKGDYMFIGRKRELEQLEKLYANEQFQFPVIYGRRRVGKTSLINQFVKERPML